MPSTLVPDTLEYALYWNSFQSASADTKLTLTSMVVFPAVQVAGMENDESRQWSLPSEPGSNQVPTRAPSTATRAF